VSAPEAVSLAIFLLAAFPFVVGPPPGLLFWCAERLANWFGGGK
jgi:hypothetical protein